jgi:type I restriction enzyme S subunit
MKQELIYTQKKELPQEWRWSTLGEECEINPRRTKDLGGNDNQETSFVPMEVVDGDKGIISEIRIVPFSKVKKGYTYFEENDVLFAKITPCMQNKKSVIAKGLINGFGFGTTEFHVLRCKKNVIPEWIYYFIRNQRFIDEAVKNFTGAVGQQRVPAQFIEKFQIPVPSISEQKKFMDKIDRQMAQIEIMRKEAGKQLDSTERLFEIYLNEIFNFKLNGDLPIDCKWGKLSEVVDDWKEDIVSGPFGSNLVVADYKNEGVPIIRLQNIQRMKFINSDIKYVTPEKAEELKRHSYNPGDIVIAKLGIPVGKACKISEKFEKGILVADVVRVRVDKKENDVHFMEYLLNSNFVAEQLNSKIIGSTRPRVNLYDVRDLILPVPSKLEQQKIASKLDKQMAQIDIMKKETDKQLKAVNQLPASILNEVFGQYQINS